jgi:cytochrome P450
VTIHRSAFPKPVQFYKLFEYFGANTLTTEGAEWQIHRKVVAKSFTEQNNKLVWKETVDAMLELFTLWETEGQGEEAHVQNVSELTRDITLMVISAAGG